MRPRVLLLTALVAGGLLTLAIVVCLAVGTVLLILGLALTDEADAAARPGLPRVLVARAAHWVPPVPGARAAHWVPPVPGAPTRLFHLTADPFARGQHRGVDFPARGAVRSACSGRVVFAGRVAGAGTVSVRCGPWRVSYAPFARVAVRAGEPVGPGERLGRTARGIHFGVRREGRRFGYVDPLRFLATQRAAPPVAAPPPSGAPRGGRRGPFPARPHPPPRSVAARPHAPPRSVAARPHPPRRSVAARPHPARALAPWPVWLGLLLGLTGLLGAGRLRLPHRRQEGSSCRASSTSSSSPTIQSSR